MILKNLHIHRGYRSEDPLRGEIEFKTEDGNELKLKLDEQLAQEIVKLCAEAVVRAGKAAADALIADASSQNLIEQETGGDDGAE